MPLPIIPSGVDEDAVGPVDIIVFITGPLGTYAPVETTPYPGTISIGVAIPGPTHNPIPRVPPYEIPPPDPDTGIIPKETPPPRVMSVVGYDDNDVKGLSAVRGINQDGSGSATFYGTAPDDGDTVEVVVGNTVRQTFKVQTRDAIIAAQGEEADQTVTVSGPGYVTELAKVRVLPDLGAEDPTRLGAPAQKTRYWNWTASTGIDDTAWPRPVVTDPFYGGQPGTLGGQRFVRPQGLPYDVQWIGPRSAVSAIPVGDWYLRAAFSIPEGLYNVYAFANDEHETWIDGVKVLERTGFYNGQMEKLSEPLQLSGTHFHFISVRATNRSGRGGYGMVIMPFNDTSRNGIPYVQTGVSGWKCLGYPATPPGMTAGKILRIIKAEAQVRDAWPGWTLMFTDDHDSAGQPWPVLYGASTEVGQDFLTVLGQFAESDFDWVASPTGRRLYCYRKGNVPGRAVTITDRTQMQVTTDSSNVVDSLLVQYDGPDGNLYVPDDPVVGGREGYVTLSGVTSRSEALRLGRALLSVQSQPKTTRTPTPLQIGEGGAGDFDFDLGDTVDGYRIQTLNITEAEDGKVTVMPDLQDPLDVLQAEINRTLAKYASGANGGSLLSGDGRPTTPGAVGTGVEYAIPVMGCHGYLSDVTDPLGPFAVERPCSINRFHGWLRFAGVTDTVIRLQINGVPVSATTIPAGRTYWNHTTGPGGFLLLAGDQLSNSLEPDGANGARGLVINTQASVA